MIIKTKQKQKNLKIIFFFENIHNNFFQSDTINKTPSDTKIIITYIKVEIISKKQLACVYNMKSLLFFFLFF